MSMLVGYGSSDDEDGDPSPRRPAKIAKTETATVRLETNETTATSVPEAQQFPRPPREIATESREAPGPAPGPSISQDVDHSVPTTPSTPPLSPYSSERQRLRNLTMPTIPNFEIPDSPPAPQTNSEEAAALAATTKKFERFLELKKQGIHFNQRLQDSTALRNPTLLPKLMDFAGISRQDSHASTLPPELGVPVVWPEECYVENLVKASERQGRKKLAERDRVDFVPASKSGGSSAKNTPGEGGSSNSEQRKSRFDKR